MPGPGGENQNDAETAAAAATCPEAGFIRLRAENAARKEAADAVEAGYEATCCECGETFNPDGPDDLIHVARQDGTACGGTGELTGSW